MKKIYNILFAATALFAFAPFMSAQDVPFPADNTITFSQTEWSKQYTIDEDSGVAYRKIISKPNTQGVYHIMLEAFVTGREIKLQKSLPADIVLVLDVSGSMGYPFDFTARESQSYSYNSYGSINTIICTRMVFTIWFNSSLLTIQGLRATVIVSVIK